MASIKEGIDFNDLEFLSFQSKASEGKTDYVPIIGHYIVYCLALLVNWLYESFLEIKENPFIIVYVLAFFAFFWIFKGIYKYLRVRFLAKHTIKKL